MLESRSGGLPTSVGPPGREGRISTNMIANGRRVLLSAALGILVTAIAAAPAVGTHRKPGSGTPFRVALDPAFKPCGSADTTHVPPLAVQSCSSPGPRITSEILTMSARGVASGFLKMTAYCTDSATPPCAPANGTDTEDLSIRFSQTDVLCAVGGVTGCTAAGADYSAPLVVQIRMRITDHSSGGAACANAPGTAPCVTATVQDKVFSFQASCAITSGANGANCSATTTADTLVPGFVKEQQAAVVSVSSVTVSDLGPDGAVGGACPPTCGTGDETLYLDESVFLP
jgi:hypothetical protein